MENINQILVNMFKDEETKYWIIKNYSINIPQYSSCIDFIKFVEDDNVIENDIGKYEMNYVSFDEISRVSRSILIPKDLESNQDFKLRRIINKIMSRIIQNIFLECLLYYKGLYGVQIFKSFFINQYFDSLSLRFSITKTYIDLFGMVLISEKEMNNYCIVTFNEHNEYIGEYCITDDISRSDYQVLLIDKTKVSMDYKIDNITFDDSLCNYNMIKFRFYFNLNIDNITAISIRNNQKHKYETITLKSKNV